MKDIERRRNSFSTSDLEWFLYNSELRFTKAYKDNPSSLDTKLWQFIYQENMRLIQEKDKEDFKEPKWEIMPLRTMKGLDEITSTILYNRGITKDVEEFLDCSLEKIKPENKGDIEKACRLILKAINQDIPITIYGDYDADGITGTVLAIKALERLGARVDYFINSRESGYAVNESGMRQIASRGIPRLIITVDNGITSYEAIEFAKKANMVVIITDHHEFNKKPNAHAVIHSKDFGEPLAGVGVMFKLIQFLYDQLNRDDIFDFLDLVAIGTVADVVPLLGENRILVKHGLEKLNKDPEIPIIALKEVLNLKTIKSKTIGFSIAPVINSASRVNGTADQVVNLFLEKDIERAKLIAKSLQDINEGRKRLVDEEVEKAEKLITSLNNIIILKSDFHKGVMGIVAGRIKEKYNRPTIILSEDEGYLSGSARSVEEFDIKKALDNCPYIETHGGHSKAAGLTLKKELFHLFYENLINQTKSLIIRPPIIKVDGKLKEINILTVEAIEDLEPYGEGFPEPIFVYEYLPEEVKVINNKHLKLIGDIDCIVWNAYDKYALKKPSKLLLLGMPKINSYSGYLEFEAQDFKEG